MYYVEANGDSWYETVKNAIFSEKYIAVTDDVLAEIMKEMDFNSATLNWAKDNQNKFIAKIVMTNF